MPNAWNSPAITSDHCAIDISFQVAPESGAMWHLKRINRYTFRDQGTADGRRGHTFTAVVLITLLSLTLPADAAANETLIPPDWQPSLSALEAKCKAELEPQQGRGPSQRELNEISSRLAEVYDAQLFVIYVRLLETLDAKQRQELFREQQHWLCDRATKAADQVQSKGGSLGALEYSGAFSDFTEKRIAALLRRMPAEADKPQPIEH